MYDLDWDPYMYIYIYLITFIFSKYFNSFIKEQQEMDKVHAKKRTNRKWKLVHPD
jgi:hypothetical protein